MALPFQQGLFTSQRVEAAIERMVEYCPPEGYYLAFSGGKDSVVLLALAEMAQVKYEAHFHRTTVDPPELRRFIRDYYPDVIVDRPPTSMFRLIIKNRIPPTRRMRYCCRVFKESFGSGRIVLTGVRRDEGTARHGRQLVHACPSQAKIIVNPMIDWSEADVWGFIHSTDMAYCSLYDEGWRRIGCIGCPCAYWKTRIREFQRWPKFYRAYLRCFDEMLEERKRNKQTNRTETTWQTAEEVMYWWLEGHSLNVGGK